MIEIKATNEKTGIKLEVHFSGEGDDLTTEAAAIVRRMPSLLERTNKRLAFEFMAKLLDDKLFDKVVDMSEE